jgi:Flp pilus assembly protein TadB
MSEESNWYVRACKTTVRQWKWTISDPVAFSRKCEKSVSQEYRDALTFTGFNLEAFETVLFSYVGTFATLILLLGIDLLLLFSRSFDSRNLFIMGTLTLILPLIVLCYLSEYVKIRAGFMKISSLGDIPEILSYIVMSMKLVPNLEHAVLFAARNSERPLAKDLKKLTWDLNLRIYSSMDDALLSFADLWGRNSEYFKRSLHLIKSSTAEPDDAQRVITLNRALDISLEGTERLMESFAAKLKTPSYILYSIFILIPLALVALLPAVTVVGMKPEITDLVLLYDFVFPALAILYSEYILMQRPVAFIPKQIPDSHPDLSDIRQRKRFAIMLSALAFLIIAPSGYLLLLIGNPGEIVATRPLGGYLTPTLPLILGGTAGISIYLYFSSVPYKRIRDRIKQMELEFADSLFVLGRRISEGKAPEESFAYTARTMEGSKIGEALEEISMNLLSMRTNLKDAIFDEDFGAFRHIYSERIRNTMLLFTESVHKNHEAAGASLIKLADHLKELSAVEERIKSSLYDVTSTMRTTAVIFAPLIAGITLALAEVITKILSQVAERISRVPADLSGMPVEIEQGAFSQSISPDHFLLAIGVYVLLISAILTRFAGSIEYGGDRTELKYDLACMLPISIVIFAVSTAASRVIFSGMV